MKRNLTLIQEHSRAYGQQKALASEVGVSEVELSRLIHDHAPKIAKLLEVLDLEIVESGHTADLRRVLKAVL